MRSSFVYHLLQLSVLCIIAVPAHAQEPFSRISLSVGRAFDINVSENEFDEFWEAGGAAEAILAAPFYAGEVQLGAAVHRFDALDAAVPRFDALLVFTGWSLNLSPFEVLSWHTGFDVGTYRMMFDEETFPGVRNESEFALGAKSRLSFNFSRTVSLYAAGRYLRVYTRPHLPLAYISGGLRLTLDSPEWLITVLR